MFQLRRTILIKNKQSNHFFENDDFERLKARFANIIYRHFLKKAARMYLETIHDEMIRNKSIVIEKNNALKNEIHNFRKICF